MVDSRFAYPLPSDLASEHAAVLMCAGISVYAPLRLYASKGPIKVGVIGVGGLGHIALQFAHALGYEVTAISSSPAKKEEALEFGADDFLVLDDQDVMSQQCLAFDLLLYTSHAKGDWTSMINSLKTRGRLIVIGFPDGPVTVDPFELVVHQLSITGSLVGNRAAMREMLSFAQEHDIRPEVEIMPMTQVNEAIRKIKANEARYRIVLVQDT
jgi:uncharacterized zinc-type alcohol dehydrogenase-like protein